MQLTCFQITLVIVITIFRKCNGQLKQIEPQQQNKYQINLESNSNFGIGCFFQYTPLKYPIDNSEEQQTMLLNAIDSISDQQNYYIHMIVINQLLRSITHVIQFKTINEEIKISFDPLKYEGQWILYYLKYDLINKQAQIIMSNENGEIYSKKIQVKNIFPNLKMNSKFGGYYNIQNSNTNQQIKLFNFKGNVFVIDYQLTQYTVSQSTLQSLFPKLKVSCGNVRFYQNWINFNQNSFITGQTDSICTNSGSSGWIKFNQNVIDEVILIQIGQSKSKTPQLYLTGNLFNFIYKPIPTNKINILVQTYSYQFPNPQQLISENTSLLLQYSILIDSYYIYEWHYFQFISSGNASTSFEIVFPKFDQHYFHNFGKVHSFSSGQMLYSIGGTQNSIQYFNGILSNFSINPSLYITQLSLTMTCHISCKTCFGPLYNNCLLCDITLFRTFDKVSNTCICQFGLPDINLAKCQNFNAFQVEFEVPQIVNNLNVALNQCEFGYYKYNSSCYKCPTIFLENIIYCADCILNPEGWSDLMVCQQDYFLNNSVFQLTDRNYIQKESFLLENNQTILCFGCQDVNPEYQSKIYSLSTYFNKGLQQFVHCKPNYDVIDYDCKVPITYASQTTSQINECGQFCASCSAAQCYYCNDPGKYFLSSDGYNCELCLIEHCQYCYIYDLQNELYSSLTQYLLKRSRLISTLQVGCAKCRQGYTFSFLTGKCEIRISFPNCLQQYENKNADTICLLLNSDKIVRNETISNCLNYIANCQICTNFDSSQQLECQTCVFGYYLNKMSKMCVLCPQAQSSCHQYNTLYQDSWMQQIELFYYKVYQNYALYDQLTSTNTYLKLQFDSCKLNYRNIQNQCYPQCLDSCLDCDFNGDCLNCRSSKYGTKQLTFQQNKGCIECPFFCELCFDVNSLDYNVNNPYFLVNPNTQIYTKKCIKPQMKENTNVYLNSQRQVLICENNQSECQIKLIKTFAFTCQNISNIGMSRMAYVYLNDQEADLINFKQVKIVQFHILFNFSSDCIINGLMFTPTQRNNLFSIQQFNIILDGLYNSTSLTISQFFKINGFDEITINKLIIQSKLSTLVFPFYIENSNVPQKITFNNCQILYSGQTFYIQILNLQELILRETNISNFNQQNEIIKISNTIDNKKMSLNLSNVTLNNISTTYSTININSQSNISIYIQYLTFINSNFTGNFIKVNCSTSQIKINMSNLVINQTIFDNYSFLNGGLEIFTILAQTNIFNSSIIKSMMFQGSEFQIYNLIILNTYVLNSSLLNQIEYTAQFDIQIVQMTLTNNTFNQCIKIFNFIQIRNCFINNVIIRYNKFEDLETQTLFYLVGAQLNIQNVKIIKLGQFLGFELHSFNKIRINSLNQSDETSPQSGLSLFSDCFSKPSSFNLFKISDCQSVDLQNIQITNSTLVDNMLIIIQNSQFSNQNQEIYISNITFRNLLIIRLKMDISVALVQIQQTSISNIALVDIIYDFIWMHQYQQELLSSSAPLLYINSFLSRVTFENIAINKIIITNSSDSIIIIQCNEVLIYNISVQNINDITQNLFEYFFIWSFYDEVQLYLETITNILELKSIGGFARITAQYIKVNQIYARHVQAASAGILKIFTQKMSSVVITNSIFTDVQTTSPYNSNGGCIYIDAIDSTLSLEISNLIVENVFNLHSGGVVYISPSQNYNMIAINNIQMSRIYSNQGTFLYIAFQNEYINHYVTIEHLYIFDCFINEMLNEHLQYLYQIDLKFYLTDCFVIDIQGGQIKLKDIFAQSVEYLGIVRIVSAISIIADQVQIQNCSTSFNQLITFQFQVSQHFAFHFNQIQISMTQTQILNYPQSNCTLTKTQLFIKEDQTYKSDCTNKIRNYDLKSYFFNETLKQCSINKILESVVNNQNIDSLVNVVLNNLTNIYANQFMFNKVICRNCLNGLLAITVNNQNIQQNNPQIFTLFNLNFYNNDCGQIGCLTLINSTQTNNISQIIANRSQTLIYESKSQTKINIYESLFFNNTAMYVTGICIFELSGSISNTIFVNNSAQICSNIYLFSIFSRFSISNILSTNNYNIDGATIFVKGFPPQLQGVNILYNNSGIDYSLIPSKLRVQYCKQLLKNVFVDQIDFAIVGDYKILGQKELVRNLMIPSGQQLNNYVYFDPYQLNFLKYNLSLRIKAINDFDEVVTNLEGYSCNVSSLIQGKFENIQIVHFSPNTLDFNLDSFIFKFDPYNNLSHTVNVHCNCINDSNYSLNFNISTFKCQQGEYYFEEQCLTCDANANYYSLDPFFGKCEILNDATTLEIKSSVIKLRAGYWRQNVLSSTVLACKNQPSNCLGGWITGDLSCKIGNLGALCEQCDIYNFLGQGSYSRNNQYKCSQCSNYEQPILKIGFILLWTLFSLYTAVSSQIECTSQFRLLKLTNKHYQILYKYTQNETSVILKMVTNFLQIIWTIQVFYNNYSINFSEILTILGDSAGQISSSFDCISSQYILKNLPYFKVIMLLIIQIMLSGFSFMVYLVKILIYKSKLQRTFFWTIIISAYLLTYQSIINELTLLLSYRKISNEYYVTGYTDILYLSKNHQQWLWKLIIPFTVIFPFSLPIMMLLYLRKAIKSLDNVKVKERLGYLINEYRQESYYWEFIKFIFRTFYVSVLNVFSDRIALKLVFILLLLTLYQILLYKVQPYSQKYLNQLEIQSTTICIICIFITNNLQYISKDESVWQLLFFTIQTCLIVYQMTVFIALFCKRMKNKIFLSVLKYNCIKRVSFLHNLVKQKQNKNLQISQRFQQIRKYLKSQTIILKQLQNQIKDLKQNQTQDNNQYQVSSYRGATERIQISTPQNASLLLENHIQDQ